MTEQALFQLGIDLEAPRNAQTEGHISTTNGSVCAHRPQEPRDLDLRTPAPDQGDPYHADEPRLAVDAIVLDIDDTLYLERDYVRSGFDAVDRWARHELGIEDFGPRAWAWFEAGQRDTIFDQVLRDCGRPADDAVVTELVARYRTHSPSISLVPDARAALERWTGTVEMAAVTDGPVSSQQAKSRALELDRWIAPVVYTAELGHGLGKPHPAAFELVQESLGVDGKRCVYVADNPAKDFEGPKALGWRTVRVRRHLGLHADAPSGSDVDHEVTSLDELDQLLAR
jgi:putative hydrolase of the HAD superfamily